MGATIRKRLRRTTLREGATPFDRLPWSIQGFVIDFLRCHQCEVTPANCQAVAEAVELRLKHGPICYSHLAVLIEDDIFLE
ncbi:hypothetical protein [Dyella jiangningensis]|uniref:Uncharacterized protein n=1 Tax=Dyella jiangningensis TaxID=1379159 RepID=A0A328P4S0_9GAMM|nr:hypothetical protein [Dyella jiangningensis]RAO77268.1 hypothetical protein CA260_05110 [Dyella jiangningensis]